MTDINIKYYDQAKNLLEKGYFNRAWTVEDLARKLAAQDKEVNRNRPKNSTIVFNSRPNNPSPLSQKAIDRDIKPTQESNDSSN